MYTKKIIKFLAIVLLTTFFSCKKNHNSTTPTPTATNKREVKFEITGTYDNHLLLAYTSIDANSETEIIALPWTKNITYNPSVAGIGLGGNSASGSTAGSPGQTVIVKIYSGDAVVKTVTATADADGLVNIPTIAYVFP